MYTDIDPEQDNVIKKLATFVAKNGPDFEKLTRENQKDNPIFAFLKPDHPYHQYYLGLVRNELNPNEFRQSFEDVSHYEIQDISQYSEEAVKQSLENLLLQKKSFDEAQNIEIEEAIVRSRRESLLKKCQLTNMDLESMDNIIDPLIESCTKDNIAKGKNWIIETMSKTEFTVDLMGDYLLNRVCHQDDVFSKKLHIVYLLNDLFHYIKRRGATHYLQNTLNRIVVPIYCNAYRVASEDERVKLTRVFDLWKKNDYLPTKFTEQMDSENITLSLDSYFETERNSHSKAINEVTERFSSEYANLKRQHDEFAAFAEKARLSHKEKIIQREQMETAKAAASTVAAISTSYNHISAKGSDYVWDNSDAKEPNKASRFSEIEYPEMTDDKKFYKTKLPHWLLPAGIMNEKIRLCDFDTKRSIKDEEFYLHTPHMPSIQLCIALDAYYAPPSHDRPRDSEGWEKLALMDFYKKKNVAKTALDLKIKVAQLKKKNIKSDEKKSEDDDLSPEKLLEANDPNMSSYKHVLPSQLTADRLKPPMTMSYVTAYPPSAVSQPLVTGKDAASYYAEFVENVNFSSYILSAKPNNLRGLLPMSQHVPNVSMIPPEDFSQPPPTMQGSFNQSGPSLSRSSNFNKSTRSGFRRPSSSERSDDSYSSDASSRSYSRSRSNSRTSRRRRSRSSSRDSNSSRESRNSRKSKKNRRKSKARDTRRKNDDNNDNKYRRSTQRAPAQHQPSQPPPAQSHHQVDSYYSPSFNDSNYAGPAHSGPPPSHEGDNGFWNNSSDDYYHQGSAPPRAQNYASNYGAQYNGPPPGPPRGHVPYYHPHHQTAPPGYHQNYNYTHYPPQGGPQYFDEYSGNGGGPPNGNGQQRYYPPHPQQMRGPRLYRGN